MSADRQELEDLSQQLQALQEQLEVMRNSLQAVRSEQTAVTEAIEAVGALETDDDVRVPIGGGAHVRASVTDIEQVLVDIGATYVAELDRSEAVTALERKRDRLADRADDLSEQIGELEAESGQLEQEAQQLQQQAVQQQLRSRREGGGPPQ